MRTRADNIISEQDMANYFNLSIRQFRILAKRENFTVSKISNKIRLYSTKDLERVFDKYKVN